jgi:plastocyanin domain-containing protein
MKSTAISIIIAGLIIGGTIMLSKNIHNNCTGNICNVQNEDKTNPNNVSIVDGKQIIEIKVKSGYSPSKTVAKAGIPTILRFTTDGTFDCSASVRIQSLNIFKVLPQTGTTNIDLGTTTFETVDGTCGMGMYPFSVEFK